MSQSKGDEPIDEEDADEAEMQTVDGGSTVPGTAYARSSEVPSFRVDSKVFSVRQLVDLIGEGDLDINPEFQRKLVWTQRQRSRLIESILLGVPLPSIYLAASGEGHLSVVDGQQRLSSIFEFIQNHFPLTELGELAQLNGLHFDQLQPQLRRRIQQTQISVNIVDPQAPDAFKFDVFTRLNTGGTALSAQEFRHAIISARTRQFLQKCAENPAFVAATGGRFLDHRRMLDCEMVLRFAAFRLADSRSPRASTSAFLTDAATHLDSCSSEEIDDLAHGFDRAMGNAYGLFGEHAFQIWPIDQQLPVRPRFNNALYDSWSVILADYSWTDLEARAARIVRIARERMTYDNRYIDALTKASASPAKIKYCFDVVREIIVEAAK